MAFMLTTCILSLFFSGKTKFFTTLAWGYFDREQRMKVVTLPQQANFSSILPGRATTADFSICRQKSKTTIFHLCKWGFGMQIGNGLLEPVLLKPFFILTSKKIWNIFTYNLYWNHNKVCIFIKNQWHSILRAIKMFKKSKGRSDLQFQK